MSKSHSAAILVSLQSHQGPPFLAPPSSRAESGPSAAEAVADIRAALASVLEAVPAVAPRFASATLEAVGGPVLERQDACRVRPVLEGGARRPPVPLVDPGPSDRPEAGEGDQLVRPGEDRDRVELHGPDPAEHRRRAAGRPGPDQTLRDQGDSSRLAGAQGDLRFGHATFLTRYWDVAVPPPVGDGGAGTRPAGVVVRRLMEQAPYEVPRIPASAGALVFDAAGRLLILRPTYKAGWTIPGGQMEADGETPWEACRREAREEIGVEIDTGRLACVDFLRPREGRPGGVRFLFDCGVLDAEESGQVEVQAGEIAEFVSCRWPKRSSS